MKQAPDAAIGQRRSGRGTQSPVRRPHATGIRRDHFGARCASQMDAGVPRFGPSFRPALTQVWIVANEAVNSR